MAEVFTKNFFMIGSVEPGQKYCFIPGYTNDTPDLWECVPGVWRWDGPGKIIGASLALLCYPTNVEVEIYVCVCRGLDVDIKNNFAAMKKEHLFYAQRDSYTPCAGVGDLIAWRLLPQDDYFDASTFDPVYIKVGVFNLSQNRKIDFDAFVNLYYTYNKGGKR